MEWLVAQRARAPGALEALHNPPPFGGVSPTAIVAGIGPAPSGTLAADTGGNGSLAHFGRSRVGDLRVFRGARQRILSRCLSGP